LPSANFGCPLCHAKYAVTRRLTPPGIIPICGECDQEFVSREDGEWLLYDRADTWSPKTLPHRSTRAAGSSGASCSIPARCLTSHLGNAPLYQLEEAVCRHW